MNNCLQCGKETTNNKFCSNSCAATYNNSRKLPRSAESRKKTSDKTKGIYRGKPASIKEKLKDQVVGPYTRVYLCTCKFSGIKWYSTTVKTVFPDLKNSYKEYQYSCRFNFAISDYPSWFAGASALITKHGWYASSSKTHPGISNPDGVSRDHRISVNFGFINNIDPSIIRHPANCRLMQHKENSSKGTSTEITLAELLLDIQKFDMLSRAPR